MIVLTVFNIWIQLCFWRLITIVKGKVFQRICKRYQGTIVGGKVYTVYTVKETIYPGKRETVRPTQTHTQIHIDTHIHRPRPQTHIHKQTHTDPQRHTDMHTDTTPPPDTHAHTHRWQGGGGIENLQCGPPNIPYSSSLHKNNPPQSILHASASLIYLKATLIISPA